MPPCKAPSLSRSFQKVKTGIEGSEGAGSQELSLKKPRPSITFMTSGLQAG